MGVLVASRLKCVQFRLNQEGLDFEADYNMQNVHDELAAVHGKNRIHVVLNWRRSKDRRVTLKNRAGHSSVLA
jgi:hypothetical protein